MKKYTKEYKDFLNESTLKTTWITPNDLIEYLDLTPRPKPSKHKLDYWIFCVTSPHIVKSIAQKILPKKQRIEVCLKFITAAYTKLSKLETEAIKACKKYIKDEIGDEELERLSVDIYNIARDDNGNMDHRLLSFFDMCKGELSQFSGGSFFHNLIVAELNKFDWSTLEKEIRGHNIFGE